MDVLEKNDKLVDKRIIDGLALMRMYYELDECSIDPVLAKLCIAGKIYNSRRFDIKGVGNLLTMTCKGTKNNNLSSFVITPYLKNLPLFSSDFVYSGENRYFLLEIYDLSIAHDEMFNSGIETFKNFESVLKEFNDMPTRSCWYDGIRPVCYSKSFWIDQDDLSIQCFLNFLEKFVDMERETPILSGNDLIDKWKKNKDYADGLIDKGGVSTDIFKKSLGAVNTRRFFHEIFFGADKYIPDGL